MTTFHWQALEHLLHYLKGIVEPGITLYKWSPLTLHAFSDVDRVGDIDDYKATGAYIIFLGKKLFPGAPINKNMLLVLPLKLNTILLHKLQLSVLGYSFTV